uniref:BAG domain-containing protein n=1 Tax=Oryza meridionalis TaxID=40149 RepID=A0A0E0CQQ1_9ORYZ
MGSYHYTSTSHFFFAGGGGGEGEYSSYKGTSSTDTHRPTTVRIPVTTQGPERSPSDDAAAAAARIQAAFRGHLVRRHAAAVRGADAEATRLERLLRRQETVDAVRGDERERARFSEALMAVLLRLDAVPGYYPAVREARRAVTRRVVGLQEVFDAVLAAPDAADTCGVPASLDQVLEGIWGESPAAPPQPPPPPAVTVEEEVVRSPCWRRFFGGV